MLADTREIHATENWSLFDHKKGDGSATKRVAGDGEYLVSRGQDRFAGFFNIEGKISVESFKGDDDKTINYPQITIFQAEALQPQSNSTDAYVKEPEIKEEFNDDGMNDDIPF